MQVSSTQTLPISAEVAATEANTLLDKVPCASIPPRVTSLVADVAMRPCPVRPALPHAADVASLHVCARSNETHTSLRYAVPLLPPAIARISVPSMTATAGYARVPHAVPVGVISTNDAPSSVLLKIASVVESVHDDHVVDPPRMKRVPSGSVAPAASQRGPPGKFDDCVHVSLHGSSPS